MLNYAENTSEYAALFDEVAEMIPDVGAIERLFGDLARLHQEVNAAFRLIHLLAERLREVEGKDAIAPDLNYVLSACDAQERQKLLEHLNGLAAQTEDTKSLRLFRELLGCSWDEAFLLLERWPGFTAEQKANCIWARQVRLAFKQAADARSEAIVCL